MIGGVYRRRGRERRLLGMGWGRSGFCLVEMVGKRVLRVRCWSVVEHYGAAPLPILAVLACGKLNFRITASAAEKPRLCLLST